MREMFTVRSLKLQWVLPTTANRQQTAQAPWQPISRSVEHRHAKATGFLNLRQPPSPAAPKPLIHPPHCVKKGNMGFIKKVREITLGLKSISAAILKLPKFYIKQ